jgi:uncharacterized protein
MRRKKLEVTAQEEIAGVLNQVDWGVLGISQSGHPVLVPLNFVHVDGTIYFHGAAAGEKFELSRKNPKATFVVVQEFSRLPSYFFDSLAARHTQFFKSVILKGSLHIVESLEEKALVLQRLMEKYQPEGRYEPITPDSDLYRQRLKGTAIIGFAIKEASAKFKFGQDETPAWRENVQQRLKERAHPLDEQTRAEMKQQESKIADESPPV